MLFPVEYEHFRGGKYQVRNVVTHTETGEKLIIYHSVYTGQAQFEPKFWARPVAMFEELVPASDFQRLRYRSDKIPRFHYANMDYISEGNRPYWDESDWRPGLCL